ncbi:MAG: hypothetical protein IJ198_08525 [Lachnospiraceae bacterium]|nr:hypothetical protein [Lachnospiraceae bacterium]
MEKEDRHGTDRERDLAADLRRLLDAGIIDTEEAARLLEKADEVDSRMVIRQLGHVDMGITEACYHRDRKRALEIAEALDRVAEIGNVTGK